MQSPRPTILALAALGFPVVAGTQPARDSYYAQVPSNRRIVSQTEASVRLRLFGDESHADYRDEAPVDGIDDARARRLLEIAERFSPILRRNNHSVPRDFKAVLGDRPLLEVDTWTDGKRTHSISLDLSPQQWNSTGQGHGDAPAVDDARVDSLLRALDPRRREPGFLNSGARVENILFFDFPGHDERSWRKAYARLPISTSKLYAHPFVEDQTVAAEERGVALFIQYWFFYPFNDGANNHEGDWEHVNVSITTRERAFADSVRSHQPSFLDSIGTEPLGLLTDGEVSRILAEENGTPLDSLTIRVVSYYFHHNVMTLDYIGPPRPRKWPRSWISRSPKPPIWEDADFVSNALRRRLALAGGRLATHPIGHIGGDSRGPDELLTVLPRFHRSYNRNSHGTYPFPATWRAVGPLDATEKISGTLEPRIRSTRRSRDTIPWYDLIDDRHYLTYRKESLILLPDWERLANLVETSAAVRREWAWLILPIHFGFPATGSPGAGAIPRVDLGNVGAVGPTYNSGWNRPAEASDYHAYEPHVLRVAFAPISPYTGMHNGWGILNVPIALWGLVPLGNVVVAQLLPWVSGAMGIFGAPPGKTFHPGPLPSRFTSIGSGPFVQFGGHDFGRLLPQTEDDSVMTFLARNAAAGAHIDQRSYHRRTNLGARVWVNLHYGDRLSIENSYGTDTTDLRYAIRDSAGGTLGTVRGSLSVKQLTGGIRFAGPLRSDVLKVFGRAGYSWTWYKVRGATLNHVPVELATTKGGHVLSLLPSRKWWPNSMYGGVGLELFAPRPMWILGRLGYGARLEVNALAHPLRASRCRCVVERGDGALSVQFGW